MKSLFVDVSGSERVLDGVTTDKYDIKALIRACDSPNVVYNKEPKETDLVVVNSMTVFARTLKGNKIIKHKPTGKFIFELKTDSLNLPSGVTLNDGMLLALKNLVFEVLYTHYSSSPYFLAPNAIPTPFGLIKRADGTIEALFQLVVNHEELEKLSDDFVYTSVESAKDDRGFYKVYKQFKFTKE